MKNIILGTLAAATVIASASAASAQNRMERSWNEMRTPSATMESSYDQPARRKGISYGYNLRFERGDVGK